jgi:MFS family permease
MAMAKIGGPIWLGTIGMLWGITAACFASLRSVPQFLALRFLLGVFEAGALPGMWSYLSHFYSRQRITVPLGEGWSKLACRLVGTEYAQRITQSARYSTLQYC